MLAAAQARAAALDTQTRLTVIGRDVVGDAGLELGLARRVLAQAGLDDVAEDDLVELVAADAGALEGLFHGDGAELGRRAAGEAALELALGGADRGEDDDVVVCHYSLLQATCDPNVGFSRVSYAPAGRSAYLMDNLSRLDGSVFGPSGHFLGQERGHFDRGRAQPEASVVAELLGEGVVDAGTADH